MNEETFVPFEEYYEKLKIDTCNDEVEKIDIQETFEHYKRMVATSGNQV